MGIFNFLFSLCSSSRRLNAQTTRKEKQGMRLWHTGSFGIGIKYATHRKFWNKIWPAARKIWDTSLAIEIILVRYTRKNLRWKRHVKKTWKKLEKTYIYLSQYFHLILKAQVFFKFQICHYKCSSGRDVSTFKEKWLKMMQCSRLD